MLSSGLTDAAGGRSSTCSLWTAVSVYFEYRGALWSYLNVSTMALGAF